MSTHSDASPSDSSEPSLRTEQKVESNLNQIDPAAVELDPRLATTQISQNVQGDHNVVTGSVSGGNVFGSVGGNVGINQIFKQESRVLALHQLPPNIANFTGRQTVAKKVIELQRSATSGKATPISALAGMPGVGKSALAIYIAHQLEQDFPDVQLYVNLRGAGGSPLDPSEVLAGWLRDFGRDNNSIPKAEEPTNKEYEKALEERAKIYRSELVNRRSLILLDNACDEAQVLPLLPGSAICAVLITSRRYLADLPAETLELSVMSETEAAELLQKWIGNDRFQAEPEAVQQIIHFSGQLPLAIRIVGGILRKKSWQQKRLQAYVDRLSDEQQRLGQFCSDNLSDLNIRTSFNISYVK